jgi:transposase-like protein
MIKTQPTSSTPTVHAMVYCPLCTHTVGAEAIQVGRRTIVKPGQKCSHCSSSLDAGYIFRTDRAA